MDYPGQSGHFHFSLCDEEGVNKFFNGDAAHTMSDLQRHGVAGVQRYLGELLPMLAPTINSYTRLVKEPGLPRRRRGVLKTEPLRFA